VPDARDDPKERKESDVRFCNHFLRSVEELDLGGRLRGCHRCFAVIDEPS
jgi:hypothetical protein